MFDKLIENLSEKCWENNPEAAGDYEGEDGSLFCGNCRTPKQTDVEFRRQKMRVWCACKCCMEQAEREKAESMAVQARLKAEQLRREGFNDAAYLSMRFDRDDRPGHIISKAARRYAESFRPTIEQHGIMFMGNVGTGKTFYACCIANEVIDRGMSVLVTTLYPLIRALSDRNTANDTIDRIQRTDLLVLDDLGTVNETGSNMDRLFEIIDARYRCGKPMIVTTNIDMASMEKCSLGMRRIYDRLRERCRCVVIDGESRRRPC